MNCTPRTINPFLHITSHLVIPTTGKTVHTTYIVRTINPKTDNVFVNAQQWAAQRYNEEYANHQF
jgi:hypothetical protein